ncbi:MAG: alpha/beta hydrolase [Pseudomonadota bacterium]
MIWLVVLTALVAVLILPRVYFEGHDLRGHDAPAGQSFADEAGPSDEHKAVTASLQADLEAILLLPRREQLPTMRKYMDSLSADIELPAKFRQVDADGVPSEWVVSPHTDASRRLLYIHGGAFTIGSPRSHRNITSRFADKLGLAVLAIDYRLMPENSRMGCVADCRRAYRWLLQNGPDGTQEAKRVYVAGDSAGGNLTLSTIAWVRDQGLRQPDGAVALSPSTDSTFSSPSLGKNLETDPWLRPMFQALSRIPRPLLLWGILLHNRMSPRNPVISPVFGDLSKLPPTLVQASEAEMLFDDARRYVNRATAAGSPALLQSWGHMVHVWHFFYPELTEARDAWVEIVRFFEGLENKGDRELPNQHWE